MTKPKSTTQAAFNEAYRPFIALESPSDRTELLIGVDRLVCAATKHIGQSHDNISDVGKVVLEVIDLLDSIEIVPPLDAEHIQRLATMRNIFSTLLDMSTVVAAAQPAPTLLPSLVKKVEKG